MREYQAELLVEFQARDEQERDEIIQRLVQALQTTEFKVRAECGLVYEE